MVWKICGAVFAVGLIVTGLLWPEPAEFVPPPVFPRLEDSDLADLPRPQPGSTELATFGSGCFWCTEAVFQQLRGVVGVVSGYSGGHRPHPTYAEVCTGQTGHAEVVQVTFDPAILAYADLLEVFWRSHDPTTKDRQGHDTGSQYRSVIFTHTDQQTRLAEKYKARIDAAGVFPHPLVTEIAPFTGFFPAEALHQNYYARNASKGYCRNIITPKVEKLRAVFREKWKE